MDVVFLIMVAALVGVTALAALGLNRLEHRGGKR